MTRVSRGIPRLINAVADRALLAGYTEGSRQIDARLVRRAARELPATELSGFRELTGLRLPIALGLVAIGARSSGSPSPLSRRARRRSRSSRTTAARP